jgi:DNA replication protein DnaC
MTKRKEAEQLLQTLLPQPMIAAPMTEPIGPCSCGGSGFVHATDDAGNRSVKECSCRFQARISGKLGRAQIPERYRMTTLDGFQALGGHASLGRGLATARRFVQEYPVGTEGRGMLLVGSVGIGKTHLAVGILRELILDKGARGIFCDFRDLLNRIKRTFNDKTLSEAEILDPVFAADVLVLDELGAVQMTDWTFDAVERIINGRYNDNRSTIITTNLPNLGPGGAAAVDQGGDYGRAAAAVRGETLGDRIGARMHSRLQQMCQVVEMAGDDWRAKRGKR